MAECEFCEIIRKKLNLVYEDSNVYVMHSPKPAAAGHLIILPKKHYMIIEQVPDYEVAGMFNTANKVSSAVFESLGAQGTNIILQNGVAAGQKSSHMMIHIIPRREGDNLPLAWNPKQLSEEEMSTVELKLKDETANIGNFEENPKPKPVEIEKKPEKMDAKEGEVNYLLKQLERIP